MNVQQVKFEFESSKENLLKTILKNRENLDAEIVTVAIKEFVKNHDRYNLEKKKILDILSMS